MKKRPGVVLFAAILLFIGGGFGVVGMLMGGVQLAIKNANPNQERPTNAQARIQYDLEQKMRKDIPMFQAYEIGEFAVGAILTGMMLIGGVGLIKMQSWGRSLTIGYSVISILYKVGLLVFLVTMVLPVINSAMPEIVRDMPQANAQNAQNLADFMKIFMTVFLVGLPLVLMVFPFVILILMLLPSVGRAFRAPDVEDRGYHEDEDDGFEREKQYEY